MAQSVEGSLDLRSLWQTIDWGAGGMSSLPWSGRLASMVLPGELTNPPQDVAGLHEESRSVGGRATFEIFLGLSSEAS